MKCRNLVLIETLWNVKGGGQRKWASWYIVLIETLWNVKRRIILVVDSHQCVLIETLWNVKRNPARRWCRGSGFNRNIVECKGIAWSSRGVAFDVLIETLWNVKKEVLEKVKAQKKGFNRNIVECKGRTRTPTTQRQAWF